MHLELIVQSFSQWETKIQVIRFEVDVRKIESFHYWEFTSTVYIDVTTEGIDLTARIHPSIVNCDRGLKL